MIMSSIKRHFGFVSVMCYGIYLDLLDGYDVRVQL